MHTVPDPGSRPQCPVRSAQSAACPVRKSQEPDRARPSDTRAWRWALLGAEFVNAWRQQRPRGRRTAGLGGPMSEAWLLTARAARKNVRRGGRSGHMTRETQRGRKGLRTPAEQSRPLAQLDQAPLSGTGPAKPHPQPSRRSRRRRRPQQATTTRTAIRPQAREEGGREERSREAEHSMTHLRLRPAV